MERQEKVVLLKTIDAPAQKDKKAKRRDEAR